MTGVPIGDGHTQREVHARTKGEGSIYKLRGQTGPGGTDPADTLILDFQPPEL